MVGDDGSFVLDDTEDLNLHAQSIDRNWISDFQGGSPALAVSSLTSATLTLAPTQTPVGFFHFKASAKFNFIGKGFGIPVPSEPGQSTLTHPGDITSFAEFNFFACSPLAPASATYQLSLECYPQNADSTFPKLHWKFTPAMGTVFQRVRIDLYEPDLLENDFGRTVEELLAKTRYLSFFIYAPNVDNSAIVDFYVDDIMILPTGSLPTASSVWHLYN